MRYDKKDPSYGVTYARQNNVFDGQMESFPTRPDAYIRAYELLDSGVTDEVNIMTFEVVTRGEAHAQDSGRAPSAPTAGNADRE